MQKPTIWYGIEIGEEYGYGYTRVTVREGVDCERLLPELIDGCVDNRAGYGTAEAAARMSERFTQLQARGYAGVVHLSSFEPRVALHWQHYEPRLPTAGVPTKDYCEARVTFPENVAELTRSLELWTRLKRRAQGKASTYVTWHSPDALLGALVRMKAKPMHMVRIGDRHGQWFEWATVSPGAPVPSDQVWQYQFAG